MKTLTLTVLLILLSLGSLVVCGAKGKAKGHPDSPCGSDDDCAIGERCLPNGKCKERSDSES